MRETLETIHAPKAGPPGSPALSTFDAAAPTGIKKIMRPGESRKISIPVPIPFSTPDSFIRDAPRSQSRVLPRRRFGTRTAAPCIR